MPVAIASCATFVGACRHAQYRPSARTHPARSIARADDIVGRPDAHDGACTPYCAPAGALVKGIIGLFEEKAVAEEARAEPPKYLVDMYWLNLYIESVTAVYKDELRRAKMIKPKDARKFITDSSKQVGGYCITRVVRTLALPRSQKAPCPALQYG